MTTITFPLRGILFTSNFGGIAAVLSWSMGPGVPREYSSLMRQGGEGGKLCCSLCTSGMQWEQYSSGAIRVAKNGGGPCCINFDGNAVRNRRALSAKRRDLRLVATFQHFYGLVEIARWVG
jgi:hypothetical protein